MRCAHRFRVNANQRLIDVWLLFHCAGCGQTVRLQVLRRVRTSSIAPADLDAFQRNDRRRAIAVASDAGLMAREGFDVERAAPAIEGPRIGAGAVHARSGTSRALVEGSFDALEDVLAAVLPFGRGGCRRLLRSGAIRRAAAAAGAVELVIDWDAVRARLDR
jgi:hypothetical protein